jgi:hypothetical protein
MNCRKIYRFVSLIVAVLLAMHMSASVAFLQGGGGTWNTGLNVQNLGTTDASASLEFYDAAGNLIFADTETIEAGGNVNVYVPSISDSDLPPGQYSMVISASEPVAAVANDVNLSSKIGDSYLASNPGSTEAYLPLVYRNHSSYISIIYAQNATSSAQDITLDLYQVGSSTPAVSKTYSVPAYASQEIDLASADFDAFGNTYGSAVLTGASGDIAVMVGYVKDPGLGANSLINGEYRGIPPSLAATTLMAPLVYKNHSLWQTGISVQNVQSIATTVTITYTASSLCPLYPLVVTDTQQLGPDSSINFYLPNNSNLPNGFFGGAILSSSSTNILAILNSVKYGVPTGDVASCYEAFNPSTATDTIAAPLIYRAHADTETGINLLNAGDTSTDITVTITKSPGSTPSGPGSPGPWSFTQTGVGPGEAATFYLPSLMPGVSGLYGSAEITSTGSVPIVGVVSSARYPAGISANYTGINY